MEWATVLHEVLWDLKAIAGTVGVSGCGVGLIKFLRHAPAPDEGSVWAGCVFDTLQDLVSNDTRIGERRPGAAARAQASASEGPARVMD